MRAPAPTCATLPYKRLYEKGRHEKGNDTRRALSARSAVARNVAGTVILTHPSELLRRRRTRSHGGGGDKRRPVGPGRRDSPQGKFDGRGVGAAAIRIVGPRSPWSDIEICLHSPGGRRLLAAPVAIFPTQLAGQRGPAPGAPLWAGREAPRSAARAVSRASSGVVDSRRDSRPKSSRRAMR